jgi:hypothetical protein
MSNPRHAAVRPDADADAAAAADAADLGRVGRSRIQALRRFYERGRESLAGFPDRMGYGRMKAEEARGVSGEMMRKARQLAASYPRAEFDRMLALAERHGFPLGVSHAIRFLTVPDEDRIRFVSQAVEGHWSKRRTDAEIHKRYGNRRPAAGRARRLGGDAADACYQIVHFCGQWRRLYDALLVPGGERAKEPGLRADLSSGLRRRLAAADGAIRSLERAASAES